MARRKLTAKQRRIVKEKEKAERAAYEAGKIKPGIPKERSKRQRIKEQKRLEQIKEHQRKHPTAEQVQQMSKNQIAALTAEKLDEAYRKYYRLRQAGIMNAATALYELELAGQAGRLDRMNLNTLRALYKNVDKWLNRRDTNFKRARKAFEKMKQRTGAKNAKEAQEFYELYKKWLETSSFANSIMSPIELFREAYWKWKDSGSTDINELFAIADRYARAAYEATHPESWDFPGENEYFSSGGEDNE